MKNCLRRHSIKKNSQGTIEFLAVYIILFVMFLGVLDLALFFRQIYLVQTISDEALAKLEVANLCYGDTSGASDIFKSVIGYYFGDSPSFTVAKTNGFYIFSSGDYKFELLCRNSTMPDSLAFSYKYKGLFLFRAGYTVHSSYSSNTLYY